MATATLQSGKLSLASIESSIDNLVDELITDLFGTSTPQYGGRKNPPSSRGAESPHYPSNQQNRQMPTSGSANDQNDLYPFSTKRPRWKGLRGLWRWMHKGYSPDNPDYAHMYNPTDRSLPPWANSDRSKWSKPAWEKTESKLSLDHYTEGVSLADDLANEITTFYEQLLHERSDENIILQRFDKFRRDLKRLVMHFIKSGANPDQSGGEMRKGADGAVGSGNVSSRVPPLGGGDDEEDYIQKHAPPRNPTREREPHSLDITDDEYRAQMANATPQLDSDKAADIAKQADSDEKAGDTKSKAISTAEANKQLVEKQLEDLRKNTWSSDVPLEIEGGDYLNKWFTPARRDVKVQGLIPALKWLVKQGVDIMYPGTVAKELRKQGMKGTNGKLVIKLFNILDIPLDDSATQKAVLKALGWKKGFKLTATGEKEPPQNTGNVHVGPNDPEIDKSAPTPTSKPSEPPKATQEIPTSKSKDVPLPDGDVKPKFDKPEIVPLPDGDVKQAVPSSDEPNVDSSELVDKIAPKDGGIKGWKDPDEIEPDVARYLKKIEDREDRVAASRAWKAIKDRIKNNDIHPRDVADLIDRFKHISTGSSTKEHLILPANIKLSTNVLREFMRNECFVTRIKAKQLPVDKLKDFYLERLKN